VSTGRADPAAISRTVGAVRRFGALDRDDVVVVTGGPGAGKTTLAASFASAVGAAHASVGDELRRLRGDELWTSEDEAAYRGDTTFSRETMQRAVAGALERRGRCGIVMDGSHGLVGALVDRGEQGVWQIRLDVDEVTRRHRLARRAGEGRRSDDGLRIRSQRLALWTAVGSDPGRPIGGVDVDGSGPPAETVALALDAWTAELATRSHRGLDLLTVNAPGRPSAVMDRSDADVVRWARSGPPMDRPVDGVVVLKSGVGASALTVERTIEHLARRGHDVSEVVAWDVARRRGRTVVLAHQGLHLVHARWARWTVDPALVGGDPVDGFLAIEEHLPDDAASAERWRRVCVERERNRIAPNVWRDVAGDRSVNSHLPGVALSWLAGFGTTAIAIAVHSRPGRPALLDERPEVLGATLPSAAAADSLRGRARDGTLGLARAVTHHNNAVHCSDSVTAAAREHAIWFPADRLE